MRTDRRASVGIEALMMIPIAVIMILLGQYILESSLNRQETAVLARGSTLQAASPGAFGPLACNFDRQDMTGRPQVDQTVEQIRCTRQDGERGLSNEQPLWDEMDDAARAWRGLIRDVKPSRGPRDIVGRAETSVSMARPAFLSQRAAVSGDQRYIAPDPTLWSHDESVYRRAHDRAIWDELCKRGTWRLFPNVLPNAGRSRC